VNTILVATDGSDPSGRAVDFAVEMAKQNDAALHIINVREGYGLPSELRTDHDNAWLDQTLEAMSAGILQTSRTRAREAGAARIVLESRHGDCAEEIMRYANEKNVDLIIIGKRGTGRIAGLLLGSVSQKIVSLASRVVAVVP
jgi:nucleotide-binding universal stress UspA family protein